MDYENYLQNAVERFPLVDHEGKSGAPLERLVLADGQRLIVKRFTPAADLVMAASGDLVGREYELWTHGLLGRLPPEVEHAVVDGWVESDATVVVMRDLGDTVLTWDDRLSRERCRWVLTRVAAMHQAFLGAAPEGLTPLADLLGLFAPQRMGPHAADDNPLARIALRGWEIFAETVDPVIADPVLALLDDVTPLVDALAARPVTLVHGDLATVNMAIDGDRFTLLDWSMPAAAPGAVDLCRFIAGCASVVDATREEMIADYRGAAGPAYDETALRLGLLSALVWLGWNKALDAAEHPDPGVRAREQQDLAWWLAQGRRTLEAGLL